MNPGICIIGHGDSPLGLKLGPKIDEYTVIRLKDPSWQNVEDYGKKTHYMVASTETMLVMLDYKVVPKEYWAQPKLGTWNSLTEKRFRDVAKAPLTVQIELHRKWNGVFKKLSPDISNHSVGMAAITYAAALLGKDIKLVGFDNLLDPQRLDYYKANRGKWHSGHDWFAENKMLPMIEEEYGVKIGRI